jgi:hypothetical protein
VLEQEHLPNLDYWLRSLLWNSELPGLDGTKDKGTGTLEIHRLKARLLLSDGSVKIVQGVREVFEILEAPASSDNSKLSLQGKVVVIGRKITGLEFEESFVNTVVYSGQTT